jgi:hypothetical protein
MRTLVVAIFEQANKFYIQTFIVRESDEMSFFQTHASSNI